jgi:hypothetical protein
MLHNTNQKKKEKKKARSLKTHVWSISIPVTTYREKGKQKQKKKLSSLVWVNKNRKEQGNANSTRLACNQEFFFPFPTRAPGFFKKLLQAQAPPPTPTLPRHKKTARNPGDDPVAAMDPLIIVIAILAATFVLFTFLMCVIRLCDYVKGPYESGKITSGFPDRGEPEEILTSTNPPNGDLHRDDSS